MRRISNELLIEYSVTANVFPIQCYLCNEVPKCFLSNKFELCISFEIFYFPLFLNSDKFGHAANNGLLADQSWTLREKRNLPIRNNIQLLTKRSATNVVNYLFPRDSYGTFALWHLQMRNEKSAQKALVRTNIQIGCVRFIKWPIIRSYFREIWHTVRFETSVWTLYLSVTNYTPRFRTKNICLTQRARFNGNHYFAYNSTPF